MVVQRNLGFADLRDCGTAMLAVQSAHLEQVGKVAGEGERKPDVEGMFAVVL